MRLENVRRIAAAVTAALATVCAFPGGAGAVSSAPVTGAGSVVVDGAVNAILTVGSTIYLGGAFTHVGAYTGNFASVSTSGGTPTTLPPVEGTVNAVVSDGSGGWYIGGSFSQVGSASVSNLVHLTSAGAVDTSWVPAPNAQVDALALSGGTLYVAGLFTTIGGQFRNYLAALTPSTGTATSWNPSLDGEGKELAVSSSGSTIYVAGNFSNVGSTARTGLAAIDSSSGSATSWNPNPNATNTVNALALSPDGNTVYAGGTFTTIGGSARAGLAAIGASSGTATSWNPNPQTSSTVNALAVSSDGNTVYVGGAFTLIGGTAQSRSYLAAISSSTGNPTSWDPSPVGSSVSAIALSSDGATAYVGGTFTQIGGASRQDLAAVSTSGTGSATSWQEDTNAAPNVLAITSGAIGVGGGFSAVGLQSRNELAAVSTSGSLLDFNPGVSGGAVNALAVSPDNSTLYVGGAFTGATATVGGQIRRGLAAVTLSTGATTSWNPAPAKVVDAIATATIGSDVDVYAGLTTTPFFAAYLGSSGATPSGWTSFSSPGAAVNALATSTDGKILFLGGSFTTGPGVRIAAVDTTSGAAVAGATWTVPSLTTGAVTSLAVSSDGTKLYLGGSFTNIGPRLVSVDKTGAVGFNGNVQTGSVDAIALSGSTLYAGGTFTTAVGANGVTRTRLASFDTTTSNATSWNPAVAKAQPLALAVTSSSVLVGGSWNTTIASITLPYFATFTLSAPSVTTAPSISGTLAVGSTLTCSAGSWSNSPSSYGYQWLRGGSAISGATSSTYVTGTADVDKQLSCQVTATNGEGSASSTSSAVTIVSAPTDSVAPTVAGTVAVGTALTCNPGTWTGSPTYSYSWLDNGKAISGASSSSYTPVSANVGHAVSCQVTATNSAGSAVGTSAAVIVPAPATTTTTPPPTTSTGTSSSVGPGDGGTIALQSLASVTWAPGAFAVAGTVVVSSLKLTADVNGFSKSSPVVSVAYTAPGASVATPVFLQSPATVVFPKSTVPKTPYVASSEDGITYTPVSLLAKDELPDGQLDGYFVRRDGSVVIYTRHTSLFALLQDTQAPTKPSTLLASLRGTILTFAWPPAADNSRVIAFYEVVRGKKIVAKVTGSQTTTRFSIGRLSATSVYKVVAVDPAGNVGPLSPGVTVVVEPRPKTVPKIIPRWAKQLRLWQSTPKSVRGPRPADAPTRVPSWYGPWKTWLATRLSLRP